MVSTHTLGEPGVGGPSVERGFSTALPKTTLGRLSMWLAVAFIVGFVINGALLGVVGTSDSAAVNDFSRTYLPYWGIALFGTGAAAGVIGLIAIIRQHERSIITLLSVMPLAFVAVFLLGEFLVPH